MFVQVYRQFSIDHSMSSSLCTFSTTVVLVSLRFATTSVLTTRPCCTGATPIASSLPPSLTWEPRLTRQGTCTLTSNLLMTTTQRCSDQPTRYIVRVLDYFRVMQPYSLSLYLFTCIDSVSLWVYVHQSWSDYVWYFYCQLHDNFCLSCQSVL